jgi:putative membrane protein
LWKTAFGRRVFGTTKEMAEQSAVLAANQGLYNGFLAAGLIWSLFAAAPIQMPLRTFFLGCVIVAGIYGAITVNRRILFVQALPAAAALVCALLA